MYSAPFRPPLLLSLHVSPVVITRCGASIANHLNGNNQGVALYLVECGSTKQTARGGTVRSAAAKPVFDKYLCTLVHGALP